MQENQNLKDECESLSLLYKELVDQNKAFKALIDKFSSKFKQENQESLLMTMFFKEVESINDTYDAYELQSHLDRLIIDYKLQSMKHVESMQDTVDDDIYAITTSIDKETKVYNKSNSSPKKLPATTQIDLKVLENPNMFQNIKRVSDESQGMIGRIL